MVDDKDKDWRKAMQGKAREIEQSRHSTQKAQSYLEKHKNRQAKKSKGGGINRGGNPSTPSRAEEESSDDWED